MIFDCPFAIFFIITHALSFPLSLALFKRDNYNNVDSKHAAHTHLRVLCRMPDSSTYFNKFMQAASKQSAFFTFCALTRSGKVWL